MERLSRQELLSEIERRDEIIERLKSELSHFREYVKGRKIAVSAPETAADVAGNALCQATQDGKSFHKDQKTFDIIESALLENEFLCQLEQCEIDEMIRSMYPADAAQGDAIIRQGEYGSVLYVLEEGRVQVTKDKRFIRVMEAPCVFGELAILYHCERTASVKALTFCRIWAIDRQIFHSIMVNTAKSKHNSAFAHLRRCRRFTRLNDDQLNAMAGLAREEFWNFRTEIEKSQLPGRIYVITRGRITLRRFTATSAGAELQCLGPGDVFGELERLNELFAPPTPTSAGSGGSGVIEFDSAAASTTGQPPAASVMDLPQKPPRTTQLPRTPSQQAFNISTTFAGIANQPQNHPRDKLDTNSRQQSTTVTATSEECYFVDSVDGCYLLAMLVEQLARSLDLSASSAALVALTAQPNATNAVPTAGHVAQRRLRSTGNDNASAVSPTNNKKEPKQQLAKICLCDKDENSSVDQDDSSVLDESVDNDNDVSDEEAENADLELEDLKTVATLGVGGFGRVNLVKRFDNGKVFALKILNKAHVREMNQQEHVLNERNILISSRCDFIVRLYKTYRDAERLYMLLEYCPGGEVWTMLHKWGRFDENTSRFYCAAALEAFDFLHRRFIIYRDLKPENMLLDKCGVPKLADFGFAKRLKSDADRTWTFCGTAEYVSPEIILNKGQDIAVDIWSLGIFMYELISGSPPFASTDPMHTYNSILRGVQHLAWPRYMSDAAKSLICKFCRRDPTQRLGYGLIDDARNDPWFAGFDFIAFRNHNMRPPIIPKVRSPTDTQNFDRFPSTDNFLCGADNSGWDEEF